MKIKSYWRKLKSLAIVISFLFYISCSQNYKYEEGIKRYLSEFNSLNIDSFESINLQVFYLLDLKSCGPCLSLSLSMLNNLPCNNNLHIILINELNDNQYIDQINELKRKYIVYFDSLGLIYRYETGFGKPMYIVISDGKITEVQSVYDNQVNNVKRRLNRLLNCQI